LAQQIDVHIECSRGVRILRSLSIEMDVDEQSAKESLNPLQANVEKCTPR